MTFVWMFVEVMESFWRQDFPCFSCSMDIFVGVCDTQGVVMKKIDRHGRAW